MHVDSIIMAQMIAELPLGCKLNHSKSMVAHDTEPGSLVKTVNPTQYLIEASLNFEGLLLLPQLFSLSCGSFIDCLAIQMADHLKLSSSLGNHIILNVT